MSQATQTTFKNIQILKDNRDAAKGILKEKYNDTIATFAEIIQKVMKAQNTTSFEAMKLIKDTFSIYKTPGAPLFFAAALYEIVEGIYFKDFEN